MRIIDLVFKDLSQIFRDKRSLFFLIAMLVSSIAGSRDDFDDEYALILPPYEPAEDGGEGKPLYYDLADQTRWINHSCMPNTEVDTKFDPASRHITAWWFAVRDIEPGDEITYDYAFSGHLAVPCFCRTPACRGLIVDPDEAHLAPDKYRDMLRRDLRPAPLSRAGGS